MSEAKKELVRYCPAGPLVLKDDAPACAKCGVPLWNPVRPPRSFHKPAWATRDENGRRLGWVKTHHTFNGVHRCWNGKACAARAAAGGAGAKANGRQT